MGTLRLTSVRSRRPSNPCTMCNARRSTLSSAQMARKRRTSTSHRITMLWMWLIVLALSEHGCECNAALGPVANKKNKQKTQNQKTKYIYIYFGVPHQWPSPVQHALKKKGLYTRTVAGGQTKKSTSKRRDAGCYTHEIIAGR